MANANVRNGDSRSEIEEGRKVIAHVVFHGMGTHAPFIGIADLVRLYRKTTKNPADPDDGHINHTSQIHGSVISWASIESGSCEHRFYECYYSPVAKGQVGMMDVVGFFFGAGVQGVRYAGFSKQGRPFWRWTFGQQTHYRIRPFTFLFLMAAMIAGSVILAALAGAPGWVGLIWNPTIPAVVYALSVFSALVFMSLLACLGLMQFLGWVNKLSGGSKIGFYALTIPALVLSVLIIISAVLAGYAFILGRSGSEQLLNNRSSEINWRLVINSLSSAFLVLGLAACNAVLGALGDVVSYLSAHTASKFDRVRSEMQRRADEPLSFVEGLGKVETIAVYGHSLGSVVAYDAMNRALLRDHKDKYRYLITYGSPLNLVAFLFGFQSGRRDDELDLSRERTVASRQPLLDRASRQKVQWTSIHAYADPFAANPVAYYDMAPQAGGAIVRVASFLNRMG
jgi:hypothetical protein